MRNIRYILSLIAFCIYSSLILLSCGGGSENGNPIPAAPAVQRLDVWNDQSVHTNVPAENLAVAKITTNAENGGSALTSAKVTVTGGITAVGDIKVWWNTADNLATATLAGSQANPAIGVSYDIPLTGAGNGTGFLYFTISVPAGQGGNYSVTISGVSGATADNIPLPQSTSSKSAGFYVTLAADKVSPVSLGSVGTVKLTAEANGNNAGGNYDYQFWIQKAPQDVWDLTQDYGNGNTWNWTPTASGSYKIAVWARNNGNPSDTALSLIDFEITNDPAQVLDAWSCDSIRVALPASDIRMAKIKTTAAYGGAAFSSTNVTVTGTVTAVGDIKVWWNTVDDFGTATLAGVKTNPVVGVAYDIPIMDAGMKSGFLYYTISIPAGQSGDYKLTVSTVSGSTSDAIPLPKTTLFPVDNVTLNADKSSPGILGNVGTVKFTAEANGNNAGGNYDYQFWIQKGTQDIWELTQDYGNGNTWNWTPTASGSYKIAVWAKNVGSSRSEAITWVVFDIIGYPVTYVDLIADKNSPLPLSHAGTVLFTANANGNDSGGVYEYKFWLKNFTDPSWTMVQDYGIGNTWSWTPNKKGIYTIRVWARGKGTPVEYEASNSMDFVIK